MSAEATGAPGSSMTGAFAGAGSVGMAPEAPPAAQGMNYVCAECGELNKLRAEDVLRCRKCGHRIFYKLRTKRVVQYSAR